MPTPLGFMIYEYSWITSRCIGHDVMVALNKVFPGRRGCIVTSWFKPSIVIHRKLTKIAVDFDLSVIEEIILMCYLLRVFMTKACIPAQPRR